MWSLRGTWMANSAGSERRKDGLTYLPAAPVSGRSGGAISINGSTGPWDISR
jgi:hypothetical protein